MITVQYECYNGNNEVLREVDTYETEEQLQEFINEAQGTMEVNWSSMVVTDDHGEQRKARVVLV